MEKFRQAENGLLSPAPSESSFAYVASATLPTPRSHPLPPGSSKESALINFIDDRLLQITRRYAKSFAADASDHGLNAGYMTFDQIIADIDPVLDIVWISATPSIQIPYLLALAGHFQDFMHSFPFVTNSFRLAKRFDLAFSQLLTISDEARGHLINTTDKVRIRSLVQETRNEIVEMAAKDGHAMERDQPDSDHDETDVDDGETNDVDVSNDQSIAMSLGKVYEKTLEMLGSDFNSLPPIEALQESAIPPQIAEDVEVIDL